MKKCKKFARGTDKLCIYYTGSKTAIEACYGKCKIRRRCNCSRKQKLKTCTALCEG
jgi:hypothetical protein